MWGIFLSRRRPAKLEQRALCGRWVQGEGSQAQGEQNVPSEVLGL